MTGRCKIEIDYDDAADRAYAECLMHGWACSGAQWRVEQKITEHEDTYRERNNSYR